MRSTITYTIGVLIFLFFVLVVSSDIGWTISPFMSSGEYIIQDGVMHNKGCKLASAPFFKKKHAKLDIIIERNNEFCSECFGEDEVKILTYLHVKNLENLTDKYERSNYPDEYIAKQLSEYEDDVTSEIVDNEEEVAELEASRDNIRSYAEEAIDLFYDGYFSDGMDKLDEIINETE